MIESASKPHVLTTVAGGHTPTLMRFEDIVGELLKVVEGEEARMRRSNTTEVDIPEMSSSGSEISNPY